MLGFAIAGIIVAFVINRIGKKNAAKEAAAQE